MENRSSPQLLTAEEVAEMLSINRQTVYRMARSGELPSLRIGSAVRFSLEQIREWISIEIKNDTNYRR